MAQFETSPGLTATGSQLLATLTSTIGQLGRPSANCQQFALSLKPSATTWLVRHMHPDRPSTTASATSHSTPVHVNPNVDDVICIMTATLPGAGLPPCSRLTLCLMRHTPARVCVLTLLTATQSLSMQLHCAQLRMAQHAIQHATQHAVGNICALGAIRRGGSAA